MEKGKFNTSFIQFMLFMTLFVIGADTFIVSPLIPSITTQFHVSVSQGGLLVTAYSITYAVFAFLFGPLSDRIGRRRMLIYGILIFTIASILTGLSQSFWWLLLFRALSGLAASATSPQVWASIGDLIPFEKRGRAMGVTTAALSISQLLGVPMGAYFAGIWNWHASFFALALLSLLVLSLLVAQFPHIQPSLKGSGQKSTISMGHSLLQVLTTGKALMGLSVTFFMMVASLGMYTYLGVWLSESFGFNVRAIGAVIMIIGLGNLVGNVSGGYLADRIGKRTVVTISLITMSIALLILPYLSFSLIDALVCIFIWLFSGGASLTSLNSIISELMPSHRGTVMALNNSSMYLGTTLASIAFGMLIHRFHTFHPLGILSALSGIIAAVFIQAITRRNI